MYLVKSTASMVICCQIDSSYCHLLPNRQFIWLFVAKSTVPIVICCQIGSLYGYLIFLLNRQFFWTTGNKSYNVQFEAKPHGHVSGRQTSTLNHEGCSNPMWWRKWPQRTTVLFILYPIFVWSMKASVFFKVCHWHWHKSLHLWDTSFVTLLIETKLAQSYCFLRWINFTLSRYSRWPSLKCNQVNVPSFSL
jgi:hypothetical protein